MVVANALHESNGVGGLLDEEAFHDGDEECVHAFHVQVVLQLGLHLLRYRGHLLARCHAYILELRANSKEIQR